LSPTNPPTLHDALPISYTAFANEGKHIDPHVIRRIQGPRGARVRTPKYQPAEVIHPQLAFLMTYLMPGVIDRGTGAKARARCFRSEEHTSELQSLAYLV